MGTNSVDNWAFPCIRRSEIGDVNRRQEGPKGRTYVTFVTLLQSEGHYLKQFSLPTQNVILQQGLPRFCSKMGRI